MELSEDDIQKVILALENDQYKWRTVRGIARDSGLEKDLVHHVLKAKENAIVQSSVPSTKGEDLFTLRETFSANTSISAQLIGAFKGRAR